MIVVMEPDGCPRAVDARRHAASRISASAPTSPRARSAPSSASSARRCRPRSTTSWRSSPESSGSCASPRSTSSPAGTSTPRRPIIQVRDVDHRRRRPHHHRRPLLGRERGADRRDRQGRQGRRRHDPARRGLQAAHLPLRVPRPRRARPGDPGPGPRRDRPADHHRGDDPGRHRHRRPSTPTSSRSARATAQNYLLLEEVGKAGKPVMLKRGLSHADGGVAAGRRVRHGPGQPRRHPLRARHPHLRDRHPQHPRRQRRRRSSRASATCRSSSTPATPPASAPSSRPSPWRASPPAPTA